MLEKINKYLVWFFGLFFAIKLWERSNINKGREYERADRVFERTEQEIKARKNGKKYRINDSDDLDDKLSKGKV